MKRAVIGDWDKFIDNQREKHNQNLSVDCLLILLMVVKMSVTVPSVTDIVKCNIVHSRWGKK